MITKRDKEIIKFVEKYNSITINQCAKVFFPRNKEAYDQARKRLRAIHSEGLLKRYRKDPKSQTVYYLDKRLRTHDLKLLDAVAEFYTFPILKVKREIQVEINSDTKYVIDALIGIGKENMGKPIILEIDYTHYTSNEKIRNLINYYENQKARSYTFIVVKFSQEEIETYKIGKYSKLYLVPWNLNGFDEIVSSLRSDIDEAIALRNQ